MSQRILTHPGPHSGKNQQTQGFLCIELLSSNDAGDACGEIRVITGYVQVRSATQTVTDPQGAARQRKAINRTDELPYLSVAEADILAMLERGMPLRQRHDGSIFISKSVAVLTLCSVANPTEIPVVQLKAVSDADGRVQLRRRAATFTVVETGSSDDFLSPQQRIDAIAEILANIALRVQHQKDKTER